MVLQPRQERHLCRTSLPTQNSPAPSGVATSGDYAAPTGLAEMFASGLLQRCRAYGAAARRRRRSPPRPQGRKGGAGRKIDNGAPDDGGHEMCRGQSRPAPGRMPRLQRSGSSPVRGDIFVERACPHETPQPHEGRHRREDMPPLRGWRFISDGFLQRCRACGAADLRQSRLAEFLDSAFTPLPSAFSDRL